MKVLSELSVLMAWVIVLWIVARGRRRHRTRRASGRLFALDFCSRLFLLENLMILVPGVVLLSPKLNAIPRVVFNMAVLTCLGSIAYRFIPTTIAYAPGTGFSYFPQRGRDPDHRRPRLLRHRALQRSREDVRDPSRAR